MKKKLALLLALVMIVALAVPVTASAEPATEITLWTYPVGNYGDQATVQALTDAFTAETGRLQFHLDSSGVPPGSVVECIITSSKASVIHF